MIPKRLPQSDFDAWQKLPPSSTHKVGGEKKVDDPKIHQIDWEWSQYSQIDKGQAVVGAKKKLSIPSELGYLKNRGTAHRQRSQI